MSVAVLCASFSVAREPNYDEEKVAPYTLSCLLFALCGLCCSVMWASIFNLAVERLGKYTEVATGLFMTFAVGGGAVPLVQGIVADNLGYMASYVVPALGIAYLAAYAIYFSHPDQVEAV